MSSMYMYSLMNMMAPLVVVTKDVYNIIQLALMALMVICSIFVIIVVLFQPGNSEGIGAISGSSETFFGKNKAKSMEGKLKKLTVVSLIVILVFSVLFFLVANEVLIGVSINVIG